MPIQIQRPYVGTGCKKIEHVCTSNDKTKPPPVGVEIAAAFELMSHQATPHVPPPPPNPPGGRVNGRDPVYMVLTNVEIGAHIEFVSTTDHPDADFTKEHKDKIFELPIVGRDINGRRVIIALSEEQMKEKGLAPGESLLVRQVDESGKNGSDATAVWLDPQGWAQTQYDEPTSNGGSQRVLGAEFSVLVGDHGIARPKNAPETAVVYAKTALDAQAPTLSVDRVRMLTLKVSPADQERILAIDDVAVQHFGAAPWDSLREQLERAIAQGERGALFTKALAALTDDAFVARMEALVPGVASTGANGGLLGCLPGTARVEIDRALEVGATATVTNLDTGASQRVTIDENNRRALLNLGKIEPGDRIRVEYTDRIGNEGRPYELTYAPNAESGKVKAHKPRALSLGDVKVEEVSFTEEERASAKDLAAFIETNYSGAGGASQDISAWVRQSLQAQTGLDPVQASAAQKLLEDAAFMAKLGATRVIDPTKIRAITDAPTRVHVSFGRALPVGTTIMAQNQTTGAQAELQAQMTHRRPVVDLGEVKDGSPILVTVRSASGESETFVFRYSSKCHGGKLPTNALNTRLSPLTLPRA